MQNPEGILFYNPRCNRGLAIINSRTLKVSFKRRIENPRLPLRTTIICSTPNIQYRKS